MEGTSAGGHISVAATFLRGYAQKLGQAGVRVGARRYTGALRPLMHMLGV